MHRLVLRSLMEDGEFARLFLERMTAAWVPKVEECLKAAATGDVVDTPVHPALCALFAQHLAAMLMVHRLPPSPAVHYGVSADKLLEQAVWFILGGMGLRPEAIRRHYNPKALSLLGA
jgi:hypothetical protein